MKTFAVFTGRNLVKATATHLRSAGLKVSLEGESHVYVQAVDQQRVLNALNNWHPRNVVEMAPLPVFGEDDSAAVEEAEDE